MDYFGLNNFAGTYSPPYSFLQGSRGYYYYKVYKVATTQVSIHIDKPPLNLKSIDTTGGVPGNSYANALRGSGLFGNSQSVQVSGSSVTAVVRSGQQPNTIEVLDIDIQVAENADIGDHNITLTVDGKTSNPVVFRVGDRSPVINSISPPQGSTGEQVAATITGTGFGFNPDVSIDGLGVSKSILFSSSTEIQAVFSVADSTYEGNRNVNVVSKGVSGTGFTQIPGNSNTSNSVNFEVKPLIAAITSFAVVGKGSTRNVLVTVSPANNTKPITLSIVRTTGSGEAQFTNNSDTMPITRTQTVGVKGITESSVKDNLLLKANTSNAPSVKFSVASIKINRTVAGQSSPTDITNAATTTIVGDRIDLTGEVQSSGLNISNQIWTIPETIVKDFQVSADYMQGIKIPADGLNTSNVNFVWVNGGGVSLEDFVSKEVSYTATIDGQPLTGKFIFNVKRPVVALGTETSTTNLLQSSGQIKLIFGDGNTIAGILFKNTASPLIPSPFGGTTQWVQIVNYSKRKIVGGGVVIKDEELSGLDGCYPYTNRGSGRAFDSPFEEIYVSFRTTSYSAQITTDDDYTMWLMYKPASPDSVWVPLKKVNWFWNAQADGLNRKWTTTGNNSINPSFNDTIDFPRWTKVIASNYPCP